MNINIQKRNTKTLDISLNSKGEKLIYTVVPPKNPIQITTQRNGNNNNNQSNHSNINTNLSNTNISIQQEIPMQTQQNQIEKSDLLSKNQNTLPKITVTLPKSKNNDQNRFHFTPTPPKQPERPKDPSEKNKFIFNESTIYNKLNDSELTNNYKEPWSSISTYIKVMYNLTVENFFYPLRVHLNELKSDELDPRDLYLYEKVKIYPCYEFDDRAEYDVFVKFSIRAPKYREGSTIKERKMRQIDWTFTERLSNRKLLFFSFSPLMEKIEAVAVSRAKKGTIQNNVVPISFLQGTLDIGKEYFMFEPTDHWNGPLFDNLLNTSEMTLPKILTKPIISLDFSDNLINNESLFNVPSLFLNKNEFHSEYEIKSTGEDVIFYCNEFVSSLEKQTASKERFVKRTLNDICDFMENIERQKGNMKKFDKNSEVVKTVSTEIQKYVGFKSINEKWPFDSFSEEEFHEKCTVDHEQYKALKFSLNHHLTLVNGAPGTGKTYLACELVKLLIQSCYEHPIIVVTYKNVSLDGFLNNIANFLEKNEIDFVRIGGKPRTENKYILSKQLDRVIPPDIQLMRHQIIYLVSMNVMMNDCLKELENKPLNEVSKSIITEIDNSINIRKTLFNMFPFYSRQEEMNITNFFIPLQCIPSAESYFNCWLLGDDYFNETKRLLHRNLTQKYENLLNEFGGYLKNKENKNNSEVIDDIIGNQFFGDEEKFYHFLKANEKRINSKDLTVIPDILKKKFNPYIDETSSDRESNYLFYYIEDEKKEFIPIDVEKAMREKFIQMMSSKEKVNSFKKFLNDMKTIISEYTIILREKCQEKLNAFEKVEINHLASELSKKKLIAMTATRAAQYKSCLDLSDCRFMIVEEAGELTEPMAFSIIPKTIENLVMIGDYRQLRPTVEHTLTFHPYNHHISLFEKEVIHAKSIKAENLFTLSIQRRMHPQIASLLRQVFYNDNKDDEKLNDDESTEKLEKPFEFPNHIQFWLHDFEEETENIKMRSHVNVKEAQVCAHLFLMMLCRGYKSSEITIISLYKGQKRQIERELVSMIDRYYSDDKLKIYDAFDFENDLHDVEGSRDLKELIELRKSLVGRYVKCLDDFQGEENEVIIISLTRSQKPGFVKNENRALVTLSRARQAEFVIGNKNVFGPENTINPLWQKITSSATTVDPNAMHYNGIASVLCADHAREVIVIMLTKLSDFIECRFNCCLKKCDFMCHCGHKCNLPCHLHEEVVETRPDLSDILARRYFCSERCQNHCKNGHQCEGMCGNCSHFGCPPCQHPCNGKCHLCSRSCALKCCHDGQCQCKFSGFCADCHAKISDFHGKLKFWNKTDLVCNKCFKKRAEMKKYGKI
ncbi:hypothetical protein M9Y10_036135 [Tritrichomonas musculus]|uniref:AAA+ ATPase domain-containing protein n=1 Tax=Tritrichomonas musculus TaxID=1915356 RepID=A0ABR2GUI8_9EUKA